MIWFYRMMVVLFVCSASFRFEDTWSWLGIYSGLMIVGYITVAVFCDEYPKKGKT